MTIVTVMTVFGLVVVMTVPAIVVGLVVMLMAVFVVMLIASFLRVGVSTVIGTAGNDPDRCRDGDSKKRPSSHASSFERSHIGSAIPRMG